MVWFYRWQDWADTTVPVHVFQSHYGLILSVVVAVAPLPTISTFNPTMVWFYQVLFDLFQHSRLSIPLWSDFILSSAWSNLPGVHFQSHYGLILSLFQSWEPLRVKLLSIPLWSDFIFRAIKEKFPAATVLSIPLWSDFIGNSDTSACWSDWSFQSHYGLILSLHSVEIVVRNFVAFNPTMVWFYRSEQRSTGICSTPAFNPTMVWFYQIWSSQHRSSTTFQSHYGLILSPKIGEDWLCRIDTFNPTMVWFYQRNGKNCRDGERALSIPLWSDFIYAGVDEKLVKLALSIPLWSDFIRPRPSAFPLPTTHRESTLSIPLWSDFINW